MDPFDLKVLFDSLPLQVYWKDREGRYIGCNRAWRIFHGMADSDPIVGQTSEQLTVKTDSKKDIAVMQGKAAQVEEESFHTPAGDKYLLTSRAPIFDQEGDSIGLMGISVDVTHQKEQEKKLSKEKQDAEVVLTNVLSHLPGHVYWMNRDNVFLGCNDLQAKSAHLASPADIVGKTNHDMPWLQHADSLNALNNKVMASGREYEEEEPCTLADGREGVFLSKKAPLYDLDGEIIGVIGVSFDITDKKEAERELIEEKKRVEQANKVKSEFIANMSHDLRTPMTGVVGMLGELSYLNEDFKKVFKEDEEVLKKAEPLLEKASKDVSIANDSANILLDMFNDILEAISLDSGKVDEEPEHFRLSTVLGKQVNLLRSTASDKNLELVLDIPDNLPDVFFGFRRMLARVVLNLLSNALKFTSEGSVTVATRLVSQTNTEATMQITVTDTGMGIPEDKFEEIFHNFSRLTSSYEGNYKGTGLGLYAVKRYVETMKGEITVDSEEGKGSTFTVTIPFELSDQTIEKEVIEQAPVRESVPEATAPASTPSTQAATVLITEDNVAASLVVKGMLERLGYHADHADTGEKAIEMASSNDYQLILMDIGLPDITGLDVTVAIRQLDHPARRKVPIVALTGHVNKRDLCMSVGMQDMIHKPAKADEIQRVVSTYLASDESKEAEKNSCLHWEETIAMLGDKETALSIIKACAENLSENKSLMAKAYREHNTKELREILHHIKGGVCYLKAPDLMAALEAFHDAAREDPQNVETMIATYKGALEQIDRFTREVEAR